ncbi:MAG: recombination protein RecR [Gammaproteobacteria bacterium]|nr:recombination protein RecR [Gammaproteobacteria bacterium]
MRARGLIEQLIEALRCLPGVGPKSAQRIAFHLLERDRTGAERLAQTLVAAVRDVGHCALCRNFSEATVCAICQSSKRDRSTLCVVETPADVIAIEHAGSFDGVYFVLMGHLSPLDGVGPDALGLDRLEQRFGEGEVREVILAMGTTLEGEATAHYVAELARDKGLTVSRIAYGVPLGGELEYVDGSTLAHAIRGRREWR